MSKFLSEVKGFTPVIDILAQELGLMTAVVYGIVWRYCQMEDGVCTASRERIADHARVSTKTVERHLERLCIHNYLKDMTPDRRNAPHIYADTGRAKIIGLLTVEVAKTESLTKNPGKTESLSRLDRESYPGKTESLMMIERESKETLGGAEIIKQTESHPDMFDLASKTEVAQQREGRWTVPAEAGGFDSWVDGPVDTFAEILAGITPIMLPEKERKSWAQKLKEIAARWSTEENTITPAIMVSAIEVVPDSDIGWKTYTTPYSGNFETDIGHLLLNGGKPNGGQPKVLKVGY